MLASGLYTNVSEEQIVSQREYISSLVTEIDSIL